MAGLPQSKVLRFAAALNGKEDALYVSLKFAAKQLAPSGERVSLLKPLCWLDE